MALLDTHDRHLMLAAEIAGYLHDLGKLHAGFAREKLDGGRPIQGSPGRPATGIKEDHAKLLEAGRVYPDDDELQRHPEIGPVLCCLRADPQWAERLHIAEPRVVAGTIQAAGLGAPLRQHHAGKAFPANELSMLGDIYTFAADVRDSALDKGSGGTSVGKQSVESAEIIDTFGQHAASYAPQDLESCWHEGLQALHALLCAPSAAVDPLATRNALLAQLAPWFRRALGETRRPTNDVSLHHHAFSTASFLKAAMAEGVLRQDFKAWQDNKGLFDSTKLGRIRYRLLGIRWRWAELTRGMLSPMALVSLSARRREVVMALRRLFEQEAAIANLIYEDDDGVLVLAPGFHEGGEDEQAVARSEALFAQRLLDPLQSAIAEAIKPLGTGTPFTLFWSEPTLYLTDYAEALGLVPDTPRQRHGQAGEADLRGLWAAANAATERSFQICPQCGLRPAEARERALVESGVAHQALCDECTELSDAEAKRERRAAFEAEFGFRPRSFNLEALATAAGSARIALLSVRIDPALVVSGNALITQLARPVAKLDACRDEGIDSPNALGDWFEQQVFPVLREGRSFGSKDKTAEIARKLLGDRYWLKDDDGRGSAREVLDQLLLRESARLPDDWRLARHDGDRLALFAMRKHPSPARLQRVWDDLRGLWRDVANEVAGSLDGRLIPLSLDGAGLRFIVAANDTDDAVRRIESRLSQTFGKLRGGLAAHVSCVIMRRSFPLYLALDTLERMERRIPMMPNQPWQVASVTPSGNTTRIAWNTPQGEVCWNLDLNTNHATCPDYWHPHVILRRRGGADATELHGPDRLVHMSALKPGDVALIPPMSFDFMVLEGSARRHQLRWHRVGDELRRAHWIMGETGRAPLLLERFEAFSTLVRRTGWDLSKLKGLQGEMIETYEKWVRDVPSALRETGHRAWQTHVRNILRRYLPGDPILREDLLQHISDGRFFDAVEWQTFVAKTRLRSEPEIMA